MAFDTVRNLLGQYPFMAQMLMAVGVLILSFVSYFMTKHYLLKAVSKLIQRTKTKFDDILMQRDVLRRLSYVAPIIVIYIFAHLFPFAEDVIRKVSVALISWFMLLALGAILTAFSDIYLTLDVSKGRPIKGYIQISKLIVYAIGAIIIISSLLGRSPMVLLSGFGAMTAVILLIFRDTILSFVASIQITSNDLVRVGDWIEVPNFGADGDVVDIALHTVKIQNWDKTFTVIPTYKLIDVTFKNWRGMQQSGGRRIKRAVHVDIGSIKFCDDRMIEQFRKIHLITDYIMRKLEQLDQYNREENIDTSVLVNGRRMTNIGTFRAYVKAYLRNHKQIHQDMTFLVRQLPPGPAGLPIEIYVFTNDTAWANYEAIQADIFDHILAVVPQFDLRVFQNPTGEDFGKLAAGKDGMDEQFCAG
ncbi:MAG: mechanosensitive ion channel [Deltaproteobacteria bacterium]|nr:mechanosensitive ion channel [Deltaproteobacteria bacterium]MBW2342927.1 mechanosensitive ion channel [Deltaproteobacteria bacterium]